MIVRLEFKPLIRNLLYNVEIQSHQNWKYIDIGQEQADKVVIFSTAN